MKKEEIKTDNNELKDADLESMMMDDKAGPVFDDKDEEEKMEDDEEGEPGLKDPLNCIKAFKILVVKTLESNEMDQKRASKMEIMDFLNLLKIFNEQGIHFK